MNGCKYPGTPEPCEGYREAMEVLAEAEEALSNQKRFGHRQGCNTETRSDGACNCGYEEGQKALTRINRLKDIDQPREKE